MRYGNLHTHTVFSDGVHTMEENCLSACAAGLACLGFSDHAYGPEDTSWCMQKDATAAYIAEGLRMKESFGDRLQICLGLEVDDQSAPLEWEPDYILGAVHTLALPGGSYSVDWKPEAQMDCIREAFGGNPVDFAKCYFDRLVAFIQRMRPDVIVHFDLVTKFGLVPEEDPAYRDYALQALEEVLKYCPYLEVNTGAISRGWKDSPYPAPFLLEAARKWGARLVPGSDSHHRDHLTFGFDKVRQVAVSAGYDGLWQFSGKEFVKISF